MFPNEQHSGELPDLLDEVAQLRQERQRRDQLEAFTRRVHGTLDSTEVAYTIANDGRLLLGCDRLSVVVGHRGRYRAVAISGQEIVNRRANAVRLLESLCTTALATRESLQYPDAANPLAPEMGASIDAYVNAAHTKSLLLIPLSPPTEQDAPGENAQRSPMTPLGAIVVEQFSDGQIDLNLSRRAEAMSCHASSALNNSLQHEQIFLRPLWAFLGSALRGRIDRCISRKIIFCAILAVLSSLLYVVPAEFTLTATGTLHPERKRHVFAPVDGVMAELLVREGADVDEGQVLAKLRSSELEVKLEEVVGQLQTTSSKLASVNASRLATMSGPTRNPVRDSELAGEAEELRHWLKSLREQQSLLLQQKADLELSSPIRGEVITWGVQEKLAARPVARGQLLFTVADLAGPWEVELLLSDRRVGHLLKAQQDQGPDLAVSFILETDPNHEVHGRIKQIAKSTQVDPDHGQTVLVTVAFDKQDVELPRPGAGVKANIHCGRRALGYVWLHDLFEFVQSKVLFRL